MADMQDKFDVGEVRRIKTAELVRIPAKDGGFGKISEAPGKEVSTNY